MKGSDGFVQAYNAQAVVEPDLQLIVGQTVVAATNDKQELIPMIGIMEEQSGQRPKEVLADSGYCSEKNLEELEASGKPEDRIIGYLATERQKHDKLPDTVPARTLTEQRNPGGSHEAETTDQSRQGGACGAQDDSGTGIRADQARPRIPTVSDEGHR
jgi:hypothetical protein